MAGLIVRFVVPVAAVLALAACDGSSSNPNVVTLDVVRCSVTRSECIADAMGRLRSACRDDVDRVRVAVRDEGGETMVVRHCSD